MIQNDATGTLEGVAYLTPESDETHTVDMTGLLVNASAPTVPQATLYRVVDGGADTVVALPNAPGVAGNSVTQRVGNLVAGEYRLRLTFLTSGNRRGMTVALMVVE